MAHSALRVGAAMLHRHARIVASGRVGLVAAKARKRQDAKTPRRQELVPAATPLRRLAC
jgi:hypothetical protein